MDLTLCGQSAFNYYRIPPQVLGLYPAISLGNMGIADVVASEVMQL